MIYGYNELDIAISKLQWEIIMSEDIAVGETGIVGITLDSEDTPYLEIELNRTLNSTEKQALDIIVANHSSDTSQYTPVHKVSYYDKVSKFLTKEQWVETSHNDGTFSGLCKELIFTYQNGIMRSQSLFEYYKDGNIKCRKIDESAVYETPGEVIRVVLNDFEGRF